MSEVKNIGIVTEVRDGIVVASGLSGVGYNEMVEVHTTSGELVSGLALNLEEASTGIVILGDFSKIKEGDQITSTGKQLSINVSEEILGHIINPLGKNLKGDMDFVVKNGEEMLLDRIAPGIIDRKNVNNEKLFTTGIMAIDALIPIGRGQRELIIGDRQTGKTSVVMPIIVNQKGKDIVCIYVAIGKKSSQIANIRSKLEKLGCLGYTVIVSANASDPAAMQYIAPYAGCAIGEYFAQKGQHALVIYDDLTKHAWAYREISLLLKRPAGREAYPGDIFYLHSKL
ncbi:MAG TPA: F0F1 ATP synthase subunit alpha, partial [Candidatus Dojkabacteria bacterium]|nr:F0F1 ATP synthase subunit alpha [Candidatus Dojkabacteria bacterium]